MKTLYKFWFRLEQASAIASYRQTATEQQLEELQIVVHC